MMRGDLVARQLLADVDERRRRRRARAILAVAGRALRVVERGVVVRDQLDDPRHLVRVHVEQAGCRDRTPRRPTPRRRRSPGKTIVPSSDGGSNMPDFIVAERVEHRRVRLGRARRQHVFGEALPRERRRLQRMRLRRRRELAVDRRRPAPSATRSGRATAPVRRSSTNVSPYFVICATASTAPAVARDGHEASAAPGSPSPRGRASRPGSARCACRCARRARARSWRTGCRRGGSTP